MAIPTPTLPGETRHPTIFESIIRLVQLLSGVGLFLVMLYITVILEKRLPTDLLWVVPAFLIGLVDGKVLTSFISGLGKK